MKKRLLVMNGQRLVQNEQQIGQWSTEKVEKAGTVKPGIYNIYLSNLADKTKTNEGIILHTDQDYVFQQVGKNYIKHHKSDFDKIPEVGSCINIKYDNDKAIISVLASGQNNKAKVSR